MKEVGYLAEIMCDGSKYRLLTRILMDNEWKKVTSLTMSGFNSLEEVEHYLKNVPLDKKEFFQNVMIYESGNLNGQRHRELHKELIDLGRGSAVEKKPEKKKNNQIKLRRGIRDR